ncbi:hypothetical protein PVK06_011648 [Gossypium arboreum]|uniref:Uncharacterized protein n=1 Tax=Gossypium arboreum TaxID=29729 RepID=A0ABR0Q9B5_GOSAR|nr:hypothetical protein PVK06_011648 [Gossypium arboreum]
MSDKSINLEKSMVYFSPNTLPQQRTTLGDLLKMKVMAKLDDYLGLPLRRPVLSKVSWVVRPVESTTGQRDNCLMADRMRYPKGMEGLGFRDLRRFNVALLGRQLWHLMNYKDTLCYKVLSAKDFPNGDVFHPKSMDKPSFTWQSIAKATRVLHEGFDWNVGNGRSINIWMDNWGFEGLSRAAICLKKSWVHENKASELLNDKKDGRNKKKGY